MSVKDPTGAVPVVATGLTPRARHGGGPGHVFTPHDAKHIQDGTRC